MPIARQLEPVSDLFLTDTWMANEPVAGFIGITGKTVDWNTASALVRQCKIPTILAGGLSPQNVYEALMTVLPAGVDSCTLTNRAGGDGTPVRFEKDFTKVARFVSEARRAGQAIRKRRLELTSELANLEALLAEHKAALPAHSVRPHQILAIEALEEEITSKTSELMHLKSWDT
jgi:phosphoribosylanthranilate isomerase